MKELHEILEAPDVPSLLELQNSFLEIFKGYDVSFKRYFLSSAAQRREFPEETVPVSYIVQPPLDGNSVAVWIYLVKDPEIELLWKSGAVSSLDGSENQTREILEEYELELLSRGLSFRENCVRTWFFVHDIDNNYAGMVKARRENFESENLIPSTHYIASTGICGNPVTEGALVQMDALSVCGDFSQRYLYAPAYLNPTYEYGVTFERGVRLDFGGNRMIFISGTASIDNRGRVVHVGDVVAQTFRMWQNVEALLAEGGSGWEDVQMMLVYLRNAEDYSLVAPLFEERFPGGTYVILQAPVCRPDWLIEMECIAC